jgi:hypothetical protein
MRSLFHGLHIDAKYKIENDNNEKERQNSIKYTGKVYYSPRQ